MAVRPLLSIAAVLLVTLGAFFPVLGNGFVNWDDPFTVQRNQHLGAPGVVRWAFTTGEMGHYQPLAWLAWSQAKALFGLNPTAFHGLSLLAHLLNTILVYVACVRLAANAHIEATHRRLAAVIAAFTFAVHPIRVEAVAWVSAFPYVLSLTFLLAALLTYLTYCAASEPRRVRWLWVSVICYATSQLTRASAIGFPVVLLVMDKYLLQRVEGDGQVRSDRRKKSTMPRDPTHRAPWRALLLEKIPFLVVAFVVAAVESSTRELPTLQEVGLGARLGMAAPAAFVYLSRMVLPLRLSPLDPLPIEPRLAWPPLMLGLTGLALVTLVVWRMRTTRPALSVAWVAYVVLLGPTMGLIPSGQQATADRYMYIPGVVVSLLVGGVGASHASRNWLQRKAPALLAVAAAAALTVATWRQTTWWHDSVSLWTRVADLDPQNDIATYNLAIALAEAGREDEAIARYEQTLHLVPDHEFARHNLNLIRAVRAEREGDRLAEAGDLDAAAEQYARALAADSTRLHARAARGLALVQRGRFAEATADLRTAFEATIVQRPVQRGLSKDDLAVANALAFALAQSGAHAEARAVLTQMLERDPENHELAHNLARLLVTSPDRSVRDGAIALQLALAVRERAGAGDPRVLDTLAAAYAATGQFALARATATEAAQLARRLGDTEMAREIDQRAQEYRPRRVTSPQGR